MRVSPRRPVLLVVLAVITGCAERTLVRSIPSGAHVYWDDRLVGTTPTWFRVTRAEWRDDFALRLERDGYQPARVTVPTHVAKGRVTGGIFTLGLLWIVKRPTTLPERVDVELTPEPGAAPVAKPPPAEDRLRVLQRLRDQGLISEEEFRGRRGEILDDVAPR